MKKNIITLLVIFILFQNLIFNVINFPFLEKNWDEIFEIIVALIAILYVMFKHKITIKKKLLKMFILFVIIIIIGISGNIIFGFVNSKYYIFKDIISFLKFPATYILLKKIFSDINIDLDNYSFLNKFIKICIIVISILGIFSIFHDIGLSQNEVRNNLKPYKFLFTHPTYLVLNSIFMLALNEKFKKNKKTINIYEILLAITIFLALRTKGIITIALYFFIRYFGRTLKKYKLIYICLIIIIVFFTAHQKVSEYMAYSTSAREVFYKETVTLVKKCFPIGSGFASYASHVSRYAESKVYDFIRIPIYYVNGVPSYAVYGDTGYPYYIGQFGLFGFILICILFSKIYAISIKNMENKMPIYLIWIYILIALTTESILLNNGIELAFILAIVSLKKNGKEENKNEN